MRKSDKTHARNIEAEMYSLYQDRGAMTDADLIKAGFTQEEVTTFSPRVAARIRAVEMAEAA